MTYNYTMGVVLFQLHNGTERSIAFASQTLNSAEQKYSVGESRSTPLPAVDPNPDNSDLALIQLLHSPLEATVSLQELQQASEQDPVLSQLRIFIHSGRPPASSLLFEALY